MIFRRSTGKAVRSTIDVRDGRGDERWLNIILRRKYYPTQENVLNIKVQYYNELDIQGFSQMLKDPSFCYKFYWLEAIVNLISEGITETTFDAIIDEMIANAWYSVREFHIHLSGLQADGMVRDGLE